jgi:DNA-binding CsgD family transcriptional regulator
VGLAAADAAEDAGVIRIRGRVEFARPLVRAAVYRSACAEDRRRVHRALADATDAGTDPDRRAWHRARATAGTDEAVAAEVERSAGRVRERGGFAAAAAFLTRATALTPDPRRRAARGLDAAEASHQAGAPERALRLLAGVAAGPIDDAQRARVQLLRGRVAAASGRAREAPPLLLEAARRLERHDPAAARDTRLEALGAALVAGRLAGDVGARQVAREALRSPAPDDASGLLLQGFAIVLTEGYAAGAPALRRAVTAFCRDDVPATDAARFLCHATHAARDVWDDEAWALLCGRHARAARAAGALGVLPNALRACIGLHLAGGELGAAASMVAEAAEVAEATGSLVPRCGAVALAAWRGREAEASELIRAARTDLGLRGEGLGLTLVEHSCAVLLNGLGRYEEACEAAQRGAAHPDDLAYANWSLAELVEAAVRCGRTALARDALERLARTTGPCGTPWARGIELRSRALVAEGGEAERRHRQAIEQLGRTRLRAELARAHLLFGEWLRREGRRREAREQLRTAVGMFAAMGMDAFAGRGERELLATGERARRRAPDTREDLTAQEAQIAGLARDGLSNPEIAARLYLSARTVEWHLRKVFSKLGIASRRELTAALPEPATRA